MSHRHGSFTQMCLTSFVATGLVLAVAASAYAQAPVVPPGSGTSQAPYLVSEIGHLVWMGDTAAASSGKYYSLTTDIDASATAGWNDADTDTDVLEGFKPIGTYSSSNTRSFRGFFDGNGHTISGLIINRPGVNNVGLFGYVDSGGQVRNLGLVGGAVTGTWSVGGLVGLNYEGTVSNCYATGAVTGDREVGGLVGRNYQGTVSDCYATGAVTGNTRVGGLVGYNYSGTVSNSYWDMQTSGQSTSAGGAGKTTAEMKQQATFVGWDFTS
ncbi:MAG: hypothetical protein GXY55_12550, partial [Phycisphaerae bacterium]|nr:hypothetical protein [Phycisphaerae bacterium]